MSARPGNLGTWLMTQRTCVTAGCWAIRLKYLGDHPPQSCRRCYRIRSNLSNMSSTTMYTPARSMVNRCRDLLTTISEAERDDPLSSLERTPKLGDITNPTIIKHQWNGDPMDWESWPDGRPGPTISWTRMQRVMDESKRLNAERNKQSQTKKNVLHIAEFSSSGRGESDLYRSSPE